MFSFFSVFRLLRKRRDTMYVGVGEEIFARFPGYRRVMLLCEGMDNASESPFLTELLRSWEKKIREDPFLESYKEHPSIAAWQEAFRALEVNPNKYPPSVANLVKRVRSGKDLPFINPLVCLFNIISMKYLIPCGGDDLRNVQEGVLLCLASGEERYVPLGQPDMTEYPDPGEVVLKDVQSGEIFCRKWCWKNGERSKIDTDSSRVAINLDCMPPVELSTVQSAGEELAGLIREQCGGSVGVHLLTPESPRVAIW
jgi:lysyl-tRNA synthetase class 2